MQIQDSLFNLYIIIRGKDNSIIFINNVLRTDILVRLYILCEIFKDKLYTLKGMLTNQKNKFQFLKSPL